MRDFNTGGGICKHTKFEHGSAGPPVYIFEYRSLLNAQNFVSAEAPLPLA